MDLICCGAINWDINLFLDRLPETGEEIAVKEIDRVSGGTAANVSVAAARILGINRVAFVGALGDDLIAERQLSILIKEGVDVSGVIKIKDEESGQAYITIGANGENEIHTYFGANLHLLPQCLKEPKILKLIKSAKVAVIMDPPLETAKHFAKKCAKKGSIVIWDPGVYSEQGLNALTPTLRYIDYFILNHLEFENLLGTSDPTEIGTILNKKKKGIKVIIKHGSSGCLLRDNRTATTLHVGAVPLEQFGFKVINTVGCGDAFIGAFAAAKVEGLEDFFALRKGCAAGSFKATKKETRGSPTKEELYEMMKKWNTF